MGELDMNWINQVKVNKLDPDEGTNAGLVAAGLLLYGG